MVVRVKVRLNVRTGGFVETSAIANSGYESLEPEVVVPETVAKRLGLFPQLPSGTVIEEYRSLAGIARVYFVPEAVEVSLTASGRVEGPVLAGAAISEKEDEVLLSDKLMDALGIALEKSGEGLWRFIDEPASNLRSSEKPKKW